ncbi:MAG: pilt protein domain-containing protein [Microgenomates group bacterium GW2011_GWC1_41_8]|uniref:Ribonuclease VapC n=2 Tax=Candidatus Roizmaniibacteriota TaxID=1752723 RepID=A0A0G0VJJ7_9BACT|nr:MAG: pilt protein domain-containing protein [Candidatus Roizmanbacteria bacterium GW2011_GWB1_40_7]KKR94338.1 MAG: pilt protein domain-containing protein [Candidatus Roizmanbacteria bacterium GW2011_GWA1_41_13]KKS23549.1 MAG: pilt protein domain-containing protein [Microgenomates group bacterium GW2011_GWC1_41_8]OGK50266.1 MAG: hypothetical protein A3A55_01700 [Candidatus Roizmanbacteria bacterium RIFCSPLOWO2_01_FULL_40_14]
MKRYQFDSDVIIWHLRGNGQIRNYLETLPEIFISIITIGEVYQGVRNKIELQVAKRFVSKSIAYPVNSAISFQAINLIEKYTLSNGLLTMDAVIAATALETNRILVTGNIKHFKVIRGLKVVDWRDLIN